MSEPSAAALKISKSRSFAPQNLTWSCARIIVVQSSTIFPSSSVSAPYAIRPGVSLETSRVTIELTRSSAPGPSRSTLRSIVKSISPAVSRTARYSSSVDVTSVGAQ